MRQDSTRREKQEKYGRGQNQERVEMRLPSLRAGREKLTLRCANSIVMKVGEQTNLKWLDEDCRVKCIYIYINIELVVHFRNT